MTLWVTSNAGISLASWGRLCSKEGSGVCSKSVSPLYGNTFCWESDAWTLLVCSDVAADNWSDFGQASSFNLSSLTACVSFRSLNAVARALFVVSRRIELSRRILLQETKCRISSRQFDKMANREFNWIEVFHLKFHILLTLHLGIILFNDQLDAQFFFAYVYFNSLHVSSIQVLIIRRLNCINKISGICHSM